MSSFTTVPQVSAGGIVYRREGDRTDIVLISVAESFRWQLPKGLVNMNETQEAAALREVREETGVTAELVDLLDKIEYWYFARRGEARIRYHKSVFFYLMRYLSGDVADHDFEVNEARWVEIEQARQMLAFDNEKKLVDLAKEKIDAGIED
jgi:8-oxo-dGTP pyrophosphatase MutT (NUDIX family)